MTRYQPIYHRGLTLSDPSLRPCADRYALIAPIVAQFHRPVTVLDLGAGQGYFGLRLADEFGCVSVMVDDDLGLPGACALNDLSTTVAIHHRLSCDGLEALADAEHFDVVLALSVLHEFDDPERALHAVLRMGENVIVECPAADDPILPCPDLMDRLGEQSPLCLGLTPSETGADRPLYHYVRPKHQLRTFHFGQTEPPREHSILSTRSHKVLTIHDKEERRPWFPGINLWTWAKLGGGWPLVHEVERAVLGEYHRALGSDTDVPYAGIAHGDIAPWNVILSGALVTWIDWNDPRGTEDALELQRTLIAIRTPDDYKEP